ncbi:MAG: DUF4384 domain-containing protein [Myxococcota bacterium]|nr:DUF4384 domain-containing protein [Myxococcota bacterium]
MVEHLPELKLRRLRAGELAGQDGFDARAHLGRCGACQDRLSALELEAQRFQAEIPFERFSAGVHRAQRRPRLRPAQWLTPVVALAAVLLVLVAVGPLLSSGKERETGGRIKGDRSKRGAEVELRIAAAVGHPQRQATPQAPEVLSTGERVRIGFKPGEYRYLAAVSVDAQGMITPLYPEKGPSLPVSEDGATHFLPGSLEFTGQGAERVIVVLTERPLQMEEVKRAARLAYDAAHGDVLRMPELAVPGGQFHQTLLKP